MEEEAMTEEDDAHVSLLSLSLSPSCTHGLGHKY